MARTVTFSDARVAAALSKDFVCAWKNIRPEEAFDEGAVKGNRRLGAESLNEGAGATNVCSIFALPDGRIVHAVQGYLRPDTFLREAGFAREAAKVASGENSGQALRELYQQHAREVDGKGRPAILRAAMSQLEKSPLPSIDRLLEEKTAGLPR